MCAAHFRGFAHHLVMQHETNHPAAADVQKQSKHRLWKSIARKVKLAQRGVAVVA